jgi:porin
VVSRTVLGALIGLVTASWVVAEEPLLERQTLTGNWNGVRPALSAYGFEPYFTYTATMWSNLAGGRATGVRFNGYLDFGFEIDLAKLGTWEGLGFHGDFHWWQGQRPTEELIGGLSTMALSDWEAAATFRVFNLYLRQAFDGDRLVLKIGQMAADTDFMVSRYGGIFVNAGMGDLSFQNLKQAPIYPLAAPGFFASGRPLPWLTARFGAYTGDAGDDVVGNHGFGWALGNNAGYTFFSEIAAAAPAGCLPATYTLGGIYDTGRLGPSGTGEERSADYELYLMVDQALITNDHGEPVIGAFASLGGSPQDVHNVIDLNASAGLTLFGPLPSRQRDVLGAAVSVARFTQDFRQHESVAGSPVGHGQTVLEVTYQLAVAPWLVVQPDAQLFFAPAFSRRDAYALGVEIAVIF